MESWDVAGYKWSAGQDDGGKEQKKESRLMPSIPVSFFQIIVFLTVTSEVTVFR